MKATEQYYRDALEKICRLYSEKRSDVSDIATDVLNNEPLDGLEEKVEHRYVKYTHNGVNYVYDTLTTLVEYQKPDGSWKIVSDIQYSDEC